MMKSAKEMGIYNIRGSGFLDLGDVNKFRELYGKIKMDGTHAVACKKIGISRYTPSEMRRGRLAVIDAKRIMNFFKKNTRKEEKKMKSTKDIRVFLISQMERVAKGEQETGEAKAVCNYAQQIYNTMNMELRHAIAKKKLEGEKVTPVDL